MRIIKLIFFLAAILSYGKVWAGESQWTLGSGRLIYHVNYPLKKIEGENTHVRGRGECDKGVCHFLIAAPVKDFNSGDGNRDSHMLEVTKAAQNPMVIVRVDIPESQIGQLKEVDAAVEFAGRTHTYSHIQVTVESSGNTKTVKGTLPLLLSDFSVERPSLFTVKIDDAAPVNFETTWQLKTPGS